MRARAALGRLLGHRRPAPPLRVAAPVGLLDVLRLGPEPLRPLPGERDALRVAVVIPEFRRGSGGHGTIANLVRGLEARGHACSLWVLDEGRHAGESDARTAQLFGEFFGRVAAPLHKGLAAWTDVDVAVATGWQTVPAVLRLPGSGARAYLVQDHEPEFYATSAERAWAEWTYAQGLHSIAASPWLAGLLRERHGASASSFDLAVDHARYHPQPGVRRRDLVVFYARAVTPRRAVALGLLALEELHRRRPGVEIALFGEARRIATQFPHTDLGVLEPARLAEVYAQATAGMVLSLTNPSLIPLEMLACGLPCVDVATDATTTTFGADGPVLLAPADPLGLADALDRVLADPGGRSQAGIAWTAARTWERAAEQVEDGLRIALQRATAG